MNLPDESQVMDAQASLSVVSAMESLVVAINRVHKVFIGLAIGVPILLIMFMVMCTLFIVWSGSRNDDDLIKRINSLPADVAKALHIEQTQHITIDGNQHPIEKLAREQLVRDGKL